MIVNVKLNNNCYFYIIILLYYNIKIVKEDASGTLLVLLKSMLFVYISIILFWFNYKFNFYIF